MYGVLLKNTKSVNTAFLQLSPRARRRLCGKDICLCHTVPVHLIGITNQLVKGGSSSFYTSCIYFKMSKNNKHICIIQRHGFPLPDAQAPRFLWAHYVLAACTGHCLI